MSGTRFERYATPLPPLVRRAIALAEEVGFPVMPEGRPVGYAGPPSACVPEMGRLLAALAAARPGGRIGEHGTGVGIGTAWLATGLCGGATLVSAEIDEERARVAAGLFADRDDVEVRAGDCMEVLAGEVFDLLFMDALPWQELVPENWDRLTELVPVGGTLVFDDLKPLELWPPEWEGMVDRKREFALRNPRVIGAEIRTTPSEAALVITRVR